jgi:hypothetical protein
VYLDIIINKSLKINK